MTRVLIPWRATRSRQEPLEKVRAWHAEHGRTVELFDAGLSVFHLAAARNAAMATVAPGEVTILSDADTLPEELPLQEAIADAARTRRVHLPYTAYERELDGPFGAACSGVFVTTPEAYFAAGGMDERFVGWAPEDFAFRLAHHTLLGPMGRHRGTVTALAHDFAPRVRFTEMQRHYDRYKRASGDAFLMRRLVAHNHGLDR